jgi:alkylation response protein AidB-like acyl-CoA dehydrogenase
MLKLNEDEQAIVATVRQFVDREVRPVVAELEHANTYPGALIEQMKQLGVYGLMVPEEHGGLGVSTACFAAVTEELARGWMSLAGAMGGHSVVASLLVRFGTEEQRRRYLPRLASGEIRATMARPRPTADRTCRTPGRRPVPTGTTTSWTAARCGSRTRAAPDWSRCCARRHRRPSRHTGG